MSCQIWYVESQISVEEWPILIGLPEYPQVDVASHLANSSLSQWLPIYLASDGLKI